MNNKENILKKSATPSELLKLKQAELELRRQLPHLYGYRFYPWMRQFWNSEKRKLFLTAANQIGKSSIQIRKDIHWATAQELWPILWKPEYLANGVPNQFWYSYPTLSQATVEFDEKWVQFLPRGEKQRDPYYGWDEERKNKEVSAVHFKNGVSIYLKSFKKGLQALQTGTVYKVSLDEECPVELWDEFVFRTQAVEGYLSMVFTATMGQELWRRTMEPKNAEEEKFPEAEKIQVSLYDCQNYEDGTPSRWTNQRINQVIASCKSPQEVQRRVMGKFVKDSGLKYPMFDVSKHMIPGHPIPKSWFVYSGVDIGSGTTGEASEHGHPSAICFVAVSPDYRQARVFATWRGDGVRTTASDVYKKYLEMETDLKVSPVGRFYDWASVEFGEISSRNGGGFQRAEKSHELGEQVINVLFRNNMLYIYEQGDAGKLAGELCTLTVDGPKRKKVDDLCDALRYGIVKIPFDWSIITGTLPEGVERTPEQKLSPLEEEIAARRKEFDETEKDGEAEIQSEFEHWQECIDG